MYIPERYMTKGVLADVLAEFEWPAGYTIDDDGLPDEISVIFPGCALVFVESFESDLLMKFEIPAVEELIDLNAALRSLRDGVTVPNTPGLSGYVSPGASLDKVKHGIRDACRKVLTHFRETLLGDSSWVDRYREVERRAREALP